MGLAEVLAYELLNQTNPRGEGEPRLATVYLKKKREIREKIRAQWSLKAMFQDRQLRLLWSEHRNSEWDCSLDVVRCKI